MTAPHRLRGTRDPSPRGTRDPSPRGARDPSMLLLRALLASAPRGSAAELVEMTSTGWASATFIGARHMIRLTARDDDALTAWLADLAEAQFRLTGHLVVDLAIEGVDRCQGIADIAIEALTIEEA